MKIVVVSFERVSRSPFEEIIKEYRLRMESIFVIEERFLKMDRRDTTRQIESLLNSYKNAFICILDEAGKAKSTSNFAELLIQSEQNGKTVIFLIGPHSGFDKPIRFRYDITLSLSPMTFSHQIARLLLFEQIYRVYCLITNHPYNK